MNPNDAMIVLVIKHAKFQLYRRVHPDGVIYLENLTIDDKFINKQVWLFIYQTMCRGEKNISTS